MAIVRNRLYAKEKLGLSQEFTTAFAADKKVEFKLMPTQLEGKEFHGNLQLIRVAGTLTGGSTDNITICAYKNGDGTRLVIEPTEATLIPDITGGKFSAVFLVDAVWVAEDDSLFFFLKTGTHTYTLNELEITWRQS